MAMIELSDDQLRFSFPEVHARARFAIGFQRTLRIPDDGREYPLPAGLGHFPLRHVDDHARTVPATWLRHGGVMLPMYQAEAMWISFLARGYPMAVKIAAGSINAVTGDEWDPALHFGPSPSQRHRGTSVQDYVVVPEQPWLDGFHVGTGRIRQFVAMPLGGGYTAEEQLTGLARHGGLQIIAYPMRAAAYARWSPVRQFAPAGAAEGMAVRAAAAPDMGLGAGGLMRQSITVDPHDASVWDLDHPARCFVHIANSATWAAVTGTAPPTQPPTPEQYRQAGIPWFDHDGPGEVLPGSAVLAQLDTVASLAAAGGDPVPDDDSVPVDRVIRLGPRPGTVRELPDQL